MDINKKSSSMDAKRSTTAFCMIRNKTGRTQKKSSVRRENKAWKVSDALMLMKNQ